MVLLCQIIIYHAFFQIYIIPGVLFYSNFAMKNGKMTEDSVRERAERFGKDLVQTY